MKKVLGWVMAMMLAMQCGALAKPDAELIHMTFTCGSPMFTVNGVRKPLAEGDDSVAPYLQDDRLMVPLRAFAESFGMDVQWDAKKPDEIGLSIGELQIDIAVGASVATCNIQDFKYRDDTKLYPIQPEVMQKNGVTYVPVRALCDWLGLEASWDGDVQQAIVSERSDAQLYHLDFEVNPNEYGIDIEIIETNDTDWDVYISQQYALVPIVFDKENQIIFPPTQEKEGLGSGAGWGYDEIPANSERKYSDSVPLLPGRYTMVFKAASSAESIIMYGYREVQRPPTDLEPVAFEIPEK